MARSYKKAPVTGNAGGVSEKKDKQRAHQAQRAHFRTAVQSAAGGDDIVFEERNVAHSHIWDHAKDGKHRLALRVAHEGRALRVLMRPEWVKTDRQAHKLLAK